MIWNKIYKTSLADNETFKFFWEENHVCIVKDNPSDKAVTIEEELNAVEVDGIGNLVEKPRLIFID